MARISFVLLLDDVALGVRILSSILRTEGHDTFFVSLRHEEDFLAPPVDPFVDPKTGRSTGCSRKEVDLLVDTLREQRPDWVGISVNSKDHHLAQSLTPRLREALSVPIVWGGIDVTFNADIAVRHADVAVLGEADETILELNDAILGKIPLSGVAGIHYREGDTFRRNPLRQPPTDLDRLPLPDYDLSRYTLITADRVVRGAYHLKSNLRIGSWPLLSARGCPFRCAYCCHSVDSPEIPFPRGLRARSPEHVAREVAWIRKHQPHVRNLYVIDEVFGLNVKWLRGLARAIQGRHPFGVGAYVYPPMVSPEWLRTFRELGGEYVFMGVQTGSDRVNREVFQRKVTGDQVVAACRNLVDAGFPPLLEFIGRNPYQNEEDFRASVRFAAELPRPFRVMMIYPLFFFRNYAITNRALSDGIALEALNDCTWMAPATPELRFQDAFLFFAILSELPPDIVLPLMDDPLWRARPELVEALVEVLKHSRYHFLRSDCGIPKGDYIARLERDLATVWGSRMVRYYFGGKGRMLRLLRG